MSVLLTTLLSALLPVGVEGLKQVITTKMGGVKPTTIEEQLQIDDSEIKKLQAVAALDNPGGTPSQWVIDLRASSRYIAAGIVIISGAACLFIPTVDMEVKALGFEAANIAFGFLFGSRITTGFFKK